LTKNKFDFNFDFNLILIYSKILDQKMSEMNEMSINPIIDILSSPQELRNICNDLNLKFDHSFDLTMASNSSSMSKESNSRKSEPKLYFENSGKSLNISNIKQFLI
jgi:hypothetical protein